ncbi:hypothetical protein WA1_28200 [Scytonema hofmannii PCC 7110]|uniref:Uncharacterized protein n=1 Tax=Scytonema hofmannii PCC 7110 TaxID=128403 RepID=A0A139X5A1_9CYAN|nr:GAF domain-containing protein [Scytonema hofmannii]KYC39854.1 hypothetical protein WA1_28200 [Scytonema hofmannii PCC 7110]
MESVLPDNEALRLEALYRYQILDTSPEVAFDDLTSLAAFICKTPIALVSLVDSDRQWFKSKVGLTASETPRNVSFCTHAILHGEPLIVPDALEDPRFATNALVTGDPHIRFYAGVPLTTPQGIRIGTLCVIDREPRQLDLEQIAALEALTRQVVSLLELRYLQQSLRQQESYLRAITDAVPLEHEPNGEIILSTIIQDITERKKSEEALRREKEYISHIVTAAPTLICGIAPDGTTTFVNPAVNEITGYTTDELVGNNWWNIFYPDGEYWQVEQLFRDFERKQVINYEMRLTTKHGQKRIVSWNSVNRWNDRGELLEVIGIGADVTQQRQSEIALYQQTQRERLIAEMAKHIRQSLDLAEILKTTVSEVQQFLQCDRVFIYRFDPDWSGTVVVESVAPGCNSVLGTVIKDSFFQEPSHRQTYEQGKIQAIADIHTSDLALCHITLLAQLQIRSNLVVSIVLENGGTGETPQLWGLLVANHCFEPRKWEPVEINLLKQLSTQVSIAIQQSELYQQVQTELIERKRTEKLLRSTQNQLQRLLVHNPAIIYSCEPSGNFQTTFVSDNVFNILDW